MKTIPVLDSFQNKEKIGEMTVDLAKLPKRPDFCFSLGYMGTPFNPDAPWELVAIAPVADANYVAFVSEHGGGGEAVLSAKPLEWKEESPGWWSDASMGFNVEHNADPDEAPENRYTATWGEGDSEHFASLDEAKAWCQELADGWVRDCGQITTPPTPTNGGEAVAWRGIGTLPEDDRLVLAKCDDGRAMVYRASILARNLCGPTPEHLQFPATKWMPIPGDGLPSGKFNCPTCDGDGWVDSAPRPLCGPPRYLDDAPTPSAPFRGLDSHGRPIYSDPPTVTITTTDRTTPSAPVVDDAMAGLLDAARREFRDSDAAGDVLDWLTERAALSGVSAPVGVEYLAGGARFKLAPCRDGACFSAFPAELAGRWVALVDATDNRHITPPAAAPRVECVACEGKPAPENNPCAVCATPAASDEGEQA